MAPITNTISTFIQSQVPEFIRGDPNSGFIAFLQAYYEWMEQANSGFDIVNQSKQVPSYWDIDQTSSKFIQHFINDFLPNFPNDPALDERKLIKLSREFYQKKGSANSIQFLFRVLFNKEVDIYFPKNQVLRVSDGKWYQPKLLRVAIDPALTANNFNYQQLVGRQGLGSQSNASCVIESAAIAVDPSIGTAVLELYISNVNQQFLPQENLKVIFGFDANNIPLVFSERIINSLTGVEVAPPGGGGLKYRGKSAIYTGDPVTFIGGLQTGDANAQPAVGFVNSTSQGAITGVTVPDGSFYYRIGANTVLTVVNAPGDTTGGFANVQVSAVDTPNSKFLQVPIDTIILKQNTVLNVANFAFANFATTNINTALNLAFTTANLQFANITGVSVIFGGNNYTAPPSFNEQVVYWDDYVISIANTNTSLIPILSQPIDDLGWIAGVRVLSGGSGYSNVTDEVVVPSSIGFGATFSFQTNVSTGAITSVSVTNQGNGYFYFPYQLALANTANTMNSAAGNGAVLVGYLYGQGANLVSSVNQIGVIQDFYLSSRGFDYVADPRVSMRNEDITILDPNSNLQFAKSTAVFQGTNQNSATYVAFIDSYNTASHVLRVYDYQGNLNTVQNLIYSVGNSNVQINTSNTTPVVVYGNGQANANAIFIAGEQNQPGFYINTDGQPSADRFLQDANTFHNYSYKVLVEQALNDYKNTLMHLVHPAGMSLIGQMSVPASNVVGANAVAYVGIWPAVSGNVNTVSYPTYLSTQVGIQQEHPFDFTNQNTAFWTLNNCTPTTTTVLGPDGVQPTQQMLENGGTTNVHSIQHSFSGLVANGVYEAMIYAKANTNKYIILNFDNGSANGVSNGFFAVFNLASGTANTGTSGNGNVFGSLCTNVGNGWFYCAVSGNVDTLATTMRYGITSAVNTTAQWYPSYAGNTSNSIYISGAQFIARGAGSGPITFPYLGSLFAAGAGGTNFTANANVGDLIVLNATDTNRKQQIKSIVAVTNTTNVQLDSNTTWVWDYGATVKNGSNVISGLNIGSMNIGASDVIAANVNGTIVCMTINHVMNANAINTNTNFSANQSNVSLLVFPSINAATYLIIKQSN